MGNMGFLKTQNGGKSGGLSSAKKAFFWIRKEKGGNFLFGRQIMGLLLMGKI